jgi:hypothetical protein
MTDKGIYPVRWNNINREIRDFTIEIRVADVKGLIRCVYQHFEQKNEEANDLAAAVEKHL